MICELTTSAGIIVHFFLEILVSLKLLKYTKLNVKPAHSTRLRLEDWETNHSDSEPGGPRI